MSAQAPTLRAARTRLAQLRSTAASAAVRIERLPVPAVFAGLVAVEWACVLALARTVRHAGWIYYQGGDQLWYYTLGWLLGHGELGNARVGDTWSVALAPLARIAGPNLVSALPAIVLFNVVVLLPIAMLALYGIAARIGGRLFGYWALTLWIAVPFIGIAYTNLGYHQRYTELLLPQALGLSGLADFPTTVATLVSAYFCARVLFSEEPRLLDGLTAGAAAGIAVGIKPATSLFLLGPVLAFAYRRRFSALGMAAAGMAPSVLALAVWKERGLGSLPLFGSSYAPHRLALGLADAQPLGGIDIGRYVHLDWSHLGDNLGQLREHFWSGRVLEWLPIAGAFGIGRRSRTALLLVGGWFAAFVIVKGTYVNAGVEDGSLFRIMMPAFPAFILLLASVPLLLPHAPGRLRAWTPAFGEIRSRVRLTLIGVVILASGVVPLVAFAAARTTGGPADVAQLADAAPSIPVNVDLGLKARTGHGRVTLRWNTPAPAGGPVFYRVWRGPASGGDGITCGNSSATRSCTIGLPEVGATRQGAFIDKPGKGRWTYRIAVAANWLDDPGYGDIYYVSSPVHITAP